MEIASLSRLCLESAAENMPMWCESSLKEDFFKYMYTIGPFNGLSSRMMQQLLDITIQKQVLKASHLPILIHENITKFDLSMCHSMVTDQVIKLLYLRCKDKRSLLNLVKAIPFTRNCNGRTFHVRHILVKKERWKKLTHLNLCGCTRVSARCLNEVLPKLSSLLSLNLSHCPGCSDCLLDKFGQRGINIQELLIESCSGVTDSGIRALITNSNHPGDQQISCLGIRHLNVSSTSVSTKSLWFILEKLLKLRKLCFSNVESAAEKDCSTSSDKQYLLDLEQLDVSYTYISPSNVKWLCERCPNLAEVRMNCSDGLRDGFLQPLSYLAHLTSLNIDGVSSGFHFEHLARFLMQRGYQLKSLNASGIAGAQIFVLCLYCQALKDLVLADCQNVDASLPTWDTLTEEQRDRIRKSEEFGDLCLSDFCQLQQLNLNQTTFMNATEMQFFKLLSSHDALEKLLLKGSTAVDDEIMAKVLESSSAVTLRMLDLSGCENITIASVYKVLESCNKLRLLDLSHCWQVGQSGILTINKRLKRSGNPLKIIWV